MTIEGTNLKLKSPIINFNDNFTFPNADGTVDQVMSTDGAGNLSWVTASGGGGGATELNDLTDVTIVARSDGDILRYNGTAGEFQNTNLGLSLTPIVTNIPTTAYAKSIVTPTISNYGSYQQVTFNANVTDSQNNIVVTNANIIDNDDGTMTFTLPATADTYTFNLTAQDFGDLASDVTSVSVIATIPVVNATFRYYRITDFTGRTASSNNIMLGTFRLYTDVAGGGTAYPGNMTGDALPTPYVASASRVFSTYYAWKAFDSNQNGTFVWNLSDPAPLNFWVQIDLGSSVNVRSLSISHGQTTHSFTGASVFGSDTGAFAGEETLVINADGLLTPFAANDKFIIG
jgi:hypothetical protein